MLSSWLNFSFFENLSPTSRDAVVSAGKGRNQTSKEKEPWESASISAATSPMSSGWSPKPPLDTHTSFSEPSPGGGGGDVHCSSPVPCVKSRRNGRRSSVFFRIPDLDKVAGGGSNKDAHPKNKYNTGGVTTSLAKLGRPVSVSRRRASILPGRSSPSHVVIDATQGTAVVAQPDKDDHAPTIVEGGEGARPQLDTKRSKFKPDDSWRKTPRGELLRGWEQPSPIARPPTPTSPPTRSSPRALSEGHRRESRRDGGISRTPRVLTSEKLLADAQDVARIRSVARLRAVHQGVCWIASNWCMGEKRGVLSGERFLVLCDNMVWAELSASDCGGESDTDSKDGGGTAQGKGGFLPLVSLEDAIVQHCEVPKSNNGWIIEVVNPAASVTLWLDPETPTSLLKWGSVLCQALASTTAEDLGAATISDVEEEDE